MASRVNLASTLPTQQNSGEEKDAPLQSTVCRRSKARSDTPGASSRNQLPVVDGNILHAPTPGRRRAMAMDEEDLASLPQNHTQEAKEKVEQKRWRVVRQAGKLRCFPPQLSSCREFARRAAWECFAVCVAVFRLLLCLVGQGVRSASFSIASLFSAVSSWACGSGCAVACLFMRVVHVLFDHFVAELFYCNSMSRSWVSPSTWPWYLLIIPPVQVMFAKRNRAMVTYGGQMFISIPWLLEGVATQVVYVAVFLGSRALFFVVEALVLRMSATWPSFQAMTSTNKFHCPENHEFDAFVVLVRALTIVCMIIWWIRRQLAKYWVNLRPVRWYHKDLKQITSSYFQLHAHQKSTSVSYRASIAMLATIIAVLLGTGTAMHPLDAISHAISLALFFVGLLRRHIAKQNQNLQLGAEVRLECPICWGSELDPSSVVLLTPCGHVLCKQCAQDANLQTENAKCHVCRQVIVQSLRFSVK